MSRRSSSPPARAWAAWGAAAWSAVFALRGVYWALGGTIGLGTLSADLQARAAEGDATVLGALWVAVALLAIGTAWALALARAWQPVVPAPRPRTGRRLPTWWVWLPPLIGAAVLLLQGANYIAALAFGDRSDSATWWYGLLWGPWFVLGGVLFLTASFRYRREVMR